MFDASNVSALVANEKDNEELLTARVANYEKLYEKGMIKYNDYIKKIGLDTVDGGDNYIYDMQKTPYAVKLGVGGTQAMQAVLTDATMTLQMKKNTLVVIFGLSEEEAAKITAN